MNNINRNYWVFKTVSDGDRSYQSHTGYDDILSSKYVYDSNVANSKQVKSNDLIVLVDKKHILGFAKISRIKSYPDTKEIGRCPECRNTSYESRKTKLPKYRCPQGHEFDKPNSEIVKIKKYESYYGDSFQKSLSKNPISIIRPYFNRGYNGNLSIQSIDESFFKDFDNAAFDALGKAINYVGPEDSIISVANEDLSDEDYSPTSNDEREVVNRQIKARRGQQKFRRQLLSVYESKCCITGCSITHLLDAAHINPHRSINDNKPSNGLLLRTDIHTLFDLDMLGIHPVELTVHLNKEVNKDNYDLLEGIKVQGAPSREALAIKWDLFLKNK